MLLYALILPTISIGFRHVIATTIVLVVRTVAEMIAMKWKHLLVPIFWPLIGASAASAAPVVDDATFIVLDGFVKSVDWSGAHLKVIFHSNIDYDGADWTLVGPTPAYLRSFGWKEDVVKVGDRIDAVVRPDKNGTANAELLRFLLADYKTLETGPYGVSLMYPPGSIKETIANVADDPLASTYSNTLTCLASANKPAEAAFACRMWINADHTVRILTKRTFTGLNADNSFNLATDTGIWWLENQLGKAIFCTLIDNASMPHCDMTVQPHRVGDKWTVQMRGANTDWSETWELRPGRSL